jgi:hypothetical protein
LTKLAEIWYVGSLAVPERGTDTILYFEGQKTTLNIVNFNEILHEFSFANNK